LLSSRKGSHAQKLAQFWRVPQWFGKHPAVLALNLSFTRTGMKLLGFSSSAPEVLLHVPCAGCRLLVN
jgi:hypothetical protein